MFASACNLTRISIKLCVDIETALEADWWLLGNMSVVAVIIIAVGERGEGGGKG
jgi:hypothetical protein